MTCEPGLSKASPGRKSLGETWLAIDGMTAVVKWLERPQQALTKAEQSTPAVSLRGSLLVQTLPANVPRWIRDTICGNEPKQPQQ